jgi:hypothetical protein
MKFEIDFGMSPAYVYIRTDGEASVAGFRELLTALVNEPRWETGLKQLVDHRKLILDKLTAGDMREVKNVVKKNAEKLGNGHCAFVISGSLGFGLARMYELLGGSEIHGGIAVFYSVDEAIDWLTR